MRLPSSGDCGAYGAARKRLHPDMRHTLVGMPFELSQAIGAAEKSAIARTAVELIPRW